MKIVQAEIFDIDVEGLPTLHPIIVRLTTEDGITGVGEASLGWGIGHTGVAGMIKNLAESFAIGADPMKTERLWETMFRNSFWALGGGPVVYGAMSALDIATWDIKGKALKLPIWQLLGGRTNNSIRAYASHVQGGWGSEPKVSVTPDEYAEEAMKAVAQGYDAVKISPVIVDGKGRRSTDLTKILSNDLVKLFYNRVKAVREAIGPNVELIIDTFGLLSDTTAIQMGRLWEEFNIYYFEEPVNYNNVQMQEKVTKNVKIPMAAGERIYTRWGYRPYFEKQLLDVIQPDIGSCGGITEGKKICDYANTYDIVVQCHTYGSPITTAVSLQVETAIPNFLLHEHATPVLRPSVKEISLTNYQPVKGRFAVPELPGLGIELNDAVVNRSPHVIVK